MEFTREKNTISFSKKIPNALFKQKREWHENSRTLAHLSERGKSGGLIKAGLRS